MTDSTRYHKGEKIGGRYLVHQALRGGMGEVYLCLDLETYEPYALKTFQSRFLTDPAVRDLFKQEVVHWVALEKHPHIVRCFHMDTVANQPFMFLEWIAGDESHGTDLRSWLRRGPLSLRLALQFALDLCTALTHAQEKQPGIVHRDLKPENILVAQGEVAKVTDWGLATLVEQAGLHLVSSSEFETGGRQSLMRLGGVAGTPPYMAPEQWRAEQLDDRTDLYAVGCILYEMLTGRWPYSATSSAGFEQAHLSAPLSLLSSSLPSALVGIVSRCLAKDRSERYRNAVELAGVLRGVYAQELDQVARVLPTGEEFEAGDYNNRGVTYSNLDQSDRAIADLDRAIALQPDLAIAYSNRGNAYFHLDQLERAIEDYDRAITLDHDDAKAYTNRGNVYMHLGQYEQAIEDYDRAIALHPDFAGAYYNRGLTYANSGQFELALADFDLAIVLKPDFAEAYTYRGGAYWELDQFERALEDLDRAIALKPDYANAHLSKGVVLANAGRLTEALPCFEQAERLGDATGREYVSQMRQMLGQPSNPADQTQQAFEAFQRAASLIEIGSAAARYPLMTDPDFIAAVEQAIQTQVPPEHQPAFQQRLDWLRQIAGGQA